MVKVIGDRQCLPCVADSAGRQRAPAGRKDEPQATHRSTCMVVDLTHIDMPRVLGCRPVMQFDDERMQIR